MNIEERNEILRILSHISTSIVEIEAARKRSENSVFSPFIEVLSSLEEELIVIHSLMRQEIEQL